MRLVILLLLASTCLAEPPQHQQSSATVSEIESVTATPHQSALMVDGEHITLSRWNISMYLIHDPAKGWGGSGRVDYRLDNRWGLAVTEVNQVTSMGFTMRLGRVSR